MDHHSPREQDFVIDIESNEIPAPYLPENLRRQDFTKLCDEFTSADDNLGKSSVNPLNVTGKQMGRDKRKKASSAKKPPKPPRPPKGFSLDAADQKLIRELAELAMMKRVRIERMKALKQKKALNGSSSSNGSLFAMIFTIIFFLVILLQGMSGRSSGATFQGSPQTAQTNENGLIFIHEQLNPSASDSILPDSKSSNLLEKISGSNSASKN